ncbi:Asparagine synthetase [glutamine-hydrolyzing] [Eufriesea mexicana]|uniref:Asparagine synthetase [glutamine-hydrolyzing] n=1 Tax=Eufriesea mexicana TaxID=516756 RepID=A0A310SSL3_9HYME|nr:Asparagine synthetase [glutamine-hydrolyzing] [Eufriesea mexicana]
MCGIWGLFGLKVPSLTCICENFEKIKHRGPEATKIEFDHMVKNGYLGFHRLMIVDNIYGMQPMKNFKYPHLTLLCNGEIYNNKELGIQHEFSYATNCDVEVIIHLYAVLGAKNVTRMLDGVFAFYLLDTKNKRILIGRDPYGVRPLFRLYSDDGQLAICSESKGLIGITKQITSRCILEPFPPGSYEEYEILNDGRTKLLRRVNYYQPGDKPSFQAFIPYDRLSSTDIHQNIRELLTGAVKKRLMSDREIGCLLSGGLDSSLIAALLVKCGRDINLPYRIKSFSVGMRDSPDIIAARQVAKYIGTEHHEIIFSENDVVDILDKLIYHLETCDITTIRASIGMYLVSRYIKYHTKTTVIFSGEGADELAQGYIYFRDAPNATEAHNESVRLLKNIYLYDALRADRTTSAFSLELRVPFLDIQFTNYYLSLDAASRQPQDGSILEEELEKAYLKFPHCTPKTKEALYYRKIFEKYYEGQAENFVPYFWMPQWTKGVCDPSARFIAHYTADVEN